MPGTGEHVYWRTGPFGMHALILLGRRDYIGIAVDELHAQIGREDSNISAGVRIRKHAHGLRITVRPDHGHRLDDCADILRRRVRSQQSGSALLGHATRTQRSEVVEPACTRSLAFRGWELRVTRRD